MSLPKSITFVFEADITEKLYFLWYTEMAISWEVGKFPNIWILKKKNEENYRDYRSVLINQDINSKWE